MPKRLTEIVYNNLNLLGITSQLKDYSLAWLLNENLNYSFTLDKNKQIVENQTVFVSNKDNENIYIFENKTPKILFAELKEFDYLFLIFNSSIDIIKMIESIKKLKDINFCYLIPIDKLKKKTIKTLQSFGS